MNTPITTSGYSKHGLIPWFKIISSYLQLPHSYISYLPTPTSNIFRDFFPGLA